jgi:hypothetical protein
MGFFQRDGDQWRHKRIDKELAQWKQFQKQRRAAGQASADARQQAATINGLQMETSGGLQTETSLAQKSEQNQQKSSTSVDNSTAQHLHSTTTVDERTPLHCAQDAVIDALGVRNDPNWLGDAGFVECWLNSGADLKRDILPTIHRLMARRGGRPRPRSLRYFNEAIADAIATRTQKLSPGTPQPQEHRYGRMGPATGIAAGFAAALAEREARRRANHAASEPLLDDGRGRGFAPPAGR